VNVFIAARTTLVLIENFCDIDSFIDMKDCQHEPDQLTYLVFAAITIFSFYSIPSIEFYTVEIVLKVHFSSYTRFS